MRGQRAFGRVVRRMVAAAERAACCSVFNGAAVRLERERERARERGQQSGRRMIQRLVAEAECESGCARRTQCSRACASGIGCGAYSAVSFSGWRAPQWL